MKKLYRRGTVHPSPPTISDQLSFLPATILTLTAALSPEDREVLAYLISCSSSNFTPPFSNFSAGNPRRSTHNKSGSAKGTVVDGDHPPLFTCSCFRCYMSYWVRWDSSPNRQLIHEIIDAFEDWLAQSSKGAKNNSRKEKRNKRESNKQSGELKRSELTSSGNNESDGLRSVGESSSSGGGGGGGGGDGAVEGCGGGTEDEEKGSVRRFVNFIGERIWGALGQ